MFKKTLFASLLVIIAISATACGQIQLPASFTQPATNEQTNVAPGAAPGNAPDQSAQSSPPAPGSGPQTGLNGQGIKPGRGAAAILQLLERAGWDSGLITKISSDQITLRTIERPGFQNLPGQNNPNPRGQNQPGQNQPNQNQPGQNRRDLIHTEIVNVNSSTIIILPGKSNGTLSDLRVGDRVIVDVPKGQKYAALIINTPKDFDKDNVTLGQVTSNNNGTLTLRSPGGGDTVNTTSATQVFKLAKDGVTRSAVRDLQNGTAIFAFGKGDNDNFNAQVIFALPQGIRDNINPPGTNRKNLPPQQPPTQNQGG